MTSGRGDRTTIAEIATLAGVSAPTVSKVLNGRQGVSDTTRARVQEQLDAQGYRRRGTRRRQPVGLLDFVVRDLATPWANELVAGAEQEAARHGVGLVVTSAHGRQMGTHHWIQQLAARRTDGIVLVVSELMAGAGDALRRLNIPLVLVDPVGSVSYEQLTVSATNCACGLTAVERIGELMEQPIEIQELPQEQRSAAAVLSGAERSSAGEVVFDNVSFAYRADDPILTHLSFRIAPGEHVALVGPTGSGKSTVIRLLCRLYEPQQGRILLDGIDIRELPIPTLRQRLGVVLQDTFLFSGNVADNLRLDAAISDTELQRLCSDLGLEPLLQRLPQGLATELRERGGNLSSGERQLLSVARVAIRDPSVLVMDEATAFLDPSTEATLQRDLDRLLCDRTAIVIAHRLATVEAADRILVLQRGRLIEQGSHKVLRAAGGLYAQLADLQERGLARL